MGVLQPNQNMGLVNAGLNNMGDLPGGGGGGGVVVAPRKNTTRMVGRAAHRLCTRVGLFSALVFQCLKRTCHEQLPNVACSCNCLHRPCGEDDFTVLRKLGKGAFGVVFACTRKRDAGGKEPKTLVVKQINMGPRRSEQEDAINECRVLAKLDSPYVTQYFESFIHGTNMLCIVMEYAPKAGPGRLGPAGGALPAMF